MSNLKTAVAYARYSSSSQREESIDAQVRAIEKYCIDQGYHLLKVYADEALSGRTDDRPQFQQMIRDAKGGAFQYVVVHKLDRFSRDRYDSAVYKRKLKQSSVRLLSVLENLNDSPESIILESLLEGMSEYYSANLSREVLKGMKENALQAKFNGGSIPLGYDIVDQRYVVNDREAQAVRLIFSMFDQGHTYRAISKELERLGFLNRVGKPYKPGPLRGILTNVLYQGDYSFKVRPEEVIYMPDSVPPIVSKDLFQRVQGKIGRHNFNKASSHLYVLSGLLFHECGGKMVGVSGTSHTSKKFYYYRCEKCKAYRRVEEIEDPIVKMFKDVIFYDKNLEAIVEATYQSFMKDGETDHAKEVEKQIQSNNMALERLVKALMATDSGSEIITKKISQLERQNKDLELKLLGLRKSPTVTRESIRDTILEQKNKLDHNRLALRNLLFLFIDRVTLSEQRINVQLRFIDLSTVETSSHEDTFGVPYNAIYELKGQMVLIQVA